MKKLIFLGIVLVFSGCSIKSYRETIVYPDHNHTIYYNSIGTQEKNNWDGMYIQDEIGW